MIIFRTAPLALLEPEHPGPRPHLTKVEPESLEPCHCATSANILTWEIVENRNGCTLATRQRIPNMSRSLIRATTLSLCALVLLAVTASSAFAAGKPTEVRREFAKYGINHVEMKAIANPNGAATTLSIEYKRSSEKSFKLVLSKEIGSGSTAVTIGNVVSGLVPGAHYEIKVLAVNSFGTVTVTEEWFESVWRVNKTNTVPAEFAHSGQAMFEMKIGGSPLAIKCSESGYGVLGHKGAVGDSYNVTLSNCRYYQNGEEICKPTPHGFSLNGAFVNEAGYIYFDFPEGCFPERQPVFHLSEAFFVEAPFNIFTVKQPLTMTSKATWGGNVVNITISSEAELTSEHVGQVFGVSAEVL